LDYGYYAPTVYFSLIVEEAAMIETTETEPKEILARKKMREEVKGLQKS
jgi:glycine cleavage system protein P-like pyridoxal-binding family